MVNYTQRQSQLLKYLLANPTGVSMNQIKLVTDSSRRTIYREFGNLALILASEHLKIVNDQHHFQLQGPNQYLKALKGQLTKQTPGLAFSVQTRQNAVACQILLETETVKLKELALDFNVSVATISNDLTSLEESFADYGVKIERLKSRGIRVNGTEASIRNLFAAILTSTLDDYQFFQTIARLQQGITLDTNSERAYFMQLLEPKALLASYGAVRSLKKQYFQTVPDSQLQELIITLTTVVMRVRAKHQVEHAVGINRDQFIQFQRIALAIFAQFSPQVKSLVTGAEIDYLARQIEPLLKRIDQQTSSTVNQDLQLVYRVKQLISEVSNQFQMDFTHNQALLNNLTQHLELVFNRANLNELNGQNSELVSVREQYHDLYEAVRAGFQTVFPELHFDAAGLTYLLIHFANSYEQQISQQSLRCLVLCPNGMTTARILKTRLERLVPEIAQIQVSRIGDLETIDLNRFELILSTADLPGFKRSYKLISPLFLADEVADLRKYIRSNFPDTKQVAKLPSVTLPEVQTFSDVFNEMTAANRLLKSFQIHAVSSQQRSLAETLVAVVKQIDPKVVSDPMEVAGKLLQRATVAPVGIPKTNLGLFHTLSPNVQTTYSSIFELSDPVPLKSMDNQTILLQRIVLMLGPETISEFENVLMGRLSTEVIESPTNTQLFMTGSQEELTKLLGQAFLNEIIK